MKIYISKIKTNI